MKAEYVQHKDGTRFVPITSPDAIIDSEGKSLTTNMAEKQDVLVSGSNIKTVNGVSLLGSGDVVISGGSGDYSELTNKPKIGGVELSGDKSITALGGASKSHTHTKNQITDFPTIPTKTSQLTNDSNFIADSGYVHTDNNYDDSAVAEVAKVGELSQKVADIESEIGDIDTALSNILGTTE